MKEQLSFHTMISHTMKVGMTSPKTRMMMNSYFDICWVVMGMIFNPTQSKQDLGWEKIVAKSIPSRMQQCLKVASSAEKMGVDPHLMIAIAYYESRFETGLTSSAGAKGVMQVKKQFFDCKDCSEIEYGIKAFQVWLDVSQGDTCLALGRYAVGNKGKCGKRSKAVLKLASELACLASKEDDCYDC
jgi:hypothetical protein